MKKILYTHPAVSSVLLTVLFLFAVSAGRMDAASSKWTGGGGDGKWLTSANWDAVPSPGDVLFFTGTARLDNTNNFGAGTLFNGISITNPAGAFTLWGNSITLGGNITNNQVVTVETINLPITLSTTPFVNVTNTGALTVGGVVSGGFGLNKVGDGTLTLSGANTFTGNLEVNAGTIFISSDANLGATNASVTPGRLVLDSGTLRTLTAMTLNRNRGISVGPTTGSGFGTFDIGNVALGNAALNVTYGGTIANRGTSGGVSKLGFGTLTLSGSNTYTGPTAISNGTIALDFTQSTAPTINIIKTNSALILGGATSGAGTTNFASLVITPKASTSNYQAFASTLVQFASTFIQVNSNSGSAATLHLGGITHTNGGFVNFILPTLVGGAGDIKTTNQNVNGILGGWALVGDATQPTVIRPFTGTNFASVDANGNIYGYTNHTTYVSGTLTNIMWGTNNIMIDTTTSGDINLDVEDSVARTYEVNTITSKRTAAYSLRVGTNHVLRLGKFGALFATDTSAGVANQWAIGNSTAGGNSSAATANTGILTAGGAPNTAGEINIIVNMTGSSSGFGMRILTEIADNGSGPVSVVKSGPGFLEVGSSNTYSGGTYFLQGRIAGTAPVQNQNCFGTGDLYVFPGCYLYLNPATGNPRLPNRLFIAGDGVQQEKLGCIRFQNAGWGITNVVTLIGDATIGGNNGTPGIMGRITGPFNLTFGSGQTSPNVQGSLTISNPNNDWTGNTIMQSRPTAAAGSSLISSNSEVIPNGFGFGNVIMSGAASAGATYTWNLNGFNETINGLSTIGTGANCMIVNSLASTTSTLTVGDNDQSGTFGGSLRDGSATAILALTKIGGGNLTLASVTNNYSGQTIVKGGTLTLSGATGSITNSAITVSNNATLDVSGVTGGFNTTKSVSMTNGTMAGNTTSSAGALATLSMSNSALSVVLSQGSTNVWVSTLNTGGTTNLINISSVIGIGSYPATFHVLKYTTFNSNSFFGLGTVPSANTVGFLTNDTSLNTILLVLTDGPKPLTWTGTNATNPTYWDVATTTNWLAFGSTAVSFNPADTVIFNDSGTSTTVDVRDSVVPAAITNAGTASYTFIGSGGIAGVGSLTKSGSGTLTFLNTGVDSYRGGVTVTGGKVIFGTDNTIGGGMTVSSSAVVQMGTNGPSGTLPSGGIANDGAVLFNTATNTTYSGVISGNGVLTNLGSGRMTLSGANTFTGAVAVASGTLRTSDGSALGQANNGTYISSGATLDLNGQNLSSEPITVAGTGITNGGAIVNFGSDQNPAFTNITLTADTSFGGTGRWDLRSGTAGSANASLIGNFHLTKVGPNDVRLADTFIDSSSGVKDIDIKEGTLTLEGVTSSAGVSGNTLTVRAGATLQLVGLSASLDKTVVLNGTGTNNTLSASVAGAVNTSQINTFNSVTMSGACVFNVNAGAVLKLKAFPIGGTASLAKIGAGTNVLEDPAYTGTTAVSNGTLIVLGSKANGTGITVAAGGTLSGSGSLNENVTASGILLPGDPFSAPTAALTVNGNLTLNANTNVFVLGQGNGVGAKLDSINNLTVNGTATIQIRAQPNIPLQQGQTNTLFKVTGTSVPLSSFVIAPLTGYSFHLQTNADLLSIDIVVDTAVGDLVWDGGKTAAGVGIWDTLISKAWKRNGASTNDVFKTLDFVQFTDDGSNIVTIQGEVGPAPDGFISFNNSFTVPYLLQGSGTITGATGIRLTGSGANSVVTIANSNTFTGPVLLNNGFLTIGNGGSIGSIGTANIMMTNIAGSGFEPFPTPLSVNRSDSNLVISGSIIGHIAMTNQGTGMLTLAGNNTFTGGLYVVNGTVRLDNNGALGPAITTNGDIIAIVSNNAVLDVGSPTLAANGLNAGARPVLIHGSGIGGKGVIVNSHTNQQQNALQQVVLGSDVTFGGGNGSIWTNTGTPGRWDIRGAIASTNAILTSSNNPYAITKVGSNQVSFVGVHFDTNIGNIDIQGGMLGFEQGTISMGNPDSNLTVRAAATLEFFHSSGPDILYMKRFAITGDGILPSINSGSGISAVGGTMSLSGPCLFQVTGTSFSNYCALSGSGSLIKGTNDTELFLVGSGGYTGNTVIGGGTLSLGGTVSLAGNPVIDIVGTNASLDVSGIGGTLTLGSGQTLKGNGRLDGSLVLGSGATNSPGASIGLLTVSNAVTLGGGSTTVMEVTPSLATNDVLVVSNSLQYGGTLTIVTNGTLTAGTFQLFKAGSITGTFSATNYPAILPAPFYWTNFLLNGAVTIASAAPSSPTNAATILSVLIDGGNVVLHGTNNNIPNTDFHYKVLTTTNVALPLSSWTSLGTNNFKANGTFDFTNAISGSQRFYETLAVP